MYLDQLQRAEYIGSYRQHKGDQDILKIAEEGITDYFKQLNDTYEAS